MPELKRQELLRRLIVDHGIRGLSDYAEQIVAEALGGQRAKNGVNKGHDLTAPGFGRVEVKFRQPPKDVRKEEQVAVGNAKDKGFDFLAVVIFDPNLQIKGAVLVPYDEVWPVVTASDYGRISYSQACCCNGVINITAEVAAATMK